MKNKFSLLVAVVMMFGFMACKKSTSSAPVNPNPNITINDTSTDLTNLSKAFYTFGGAYTNDSLVIINSNSTDSSVINSQSNTNNISGSTNYLLLSIYSNKSISDKTTYSSNIVVSASFQLKGIRYQSSPTLPTSITVDESNSNYISGSYRSQVFNVTNNLDRTYPTITGRFKAYFH